MTHEEIIELGKFRFNKKIPPGNKDKNKDFPYGDLVIWLEMIDIAKEKKQPIIFVTDDKKEDWWCRFQGKTLGIRHELKKEFLKETSQLFCIYKPEQFLKFISRHITQKIPDSTIEEVAKISKSNIIISIEVQATDGQFQGFKDFLNRKNFETSYYRKSKELYEITVTFPCIPDLERRFNEKILPSALREYQISIQDYTTNLQ